MKLLAIALICTISFTACTSEDHSDGTSTIKTENTKTIIAHDTIVVKEEPNTEAKLKDAGQQVKEDYKGGRDGAKDAYKDGRNELKEEIYEHKHAN